MGQRNIEEAALWVFPAKWKERIIGAREKVRLQKGAAGLITEGEAQKVVSQREKKERRAPEMVPKGLSWKQCRGPEE